MYSKTQKTMKAPRFIYLPFLYNLNCLSLNTNISVICEGNLVYQFPVPPLPEGDTLTERISFSINRFNSPFIPIYGESEQLFNRPPKVITGGVNSHTDVQYGYQRYMHPSRRSCAI